MIFCSYHLLGKYLEYGRKVQQIIHWEYISAMPAMAKVYTPVIEYIVWFSTAGYVFNRGIIRTNCIRNKKQYFVDGKTGHPCAKPTDLINKLLLVHSNEGDIILDPFLGSGTTAVACKDLDRKYIGVEINEKYCEIARKRVERHIPNMRLFG